MAKNAPFRKERARAHPAERPDEALERQVRPDQKAPPMPQASQPSNIPAATTRTIDRRHLLAGLSVAASGLVAPPVEAMSEHSDANLIELCMRLETAQRRQNGLWLQGTGTRFFTPNTYIEDDKEREAACAAMDEEVDSLFGEIVESKVTTLDGFRAVARCLVLNEPNLRHDPGALRDVLGFSSPGEYVGHWLILYLSGGDITPENCMVEPGQVRL